MLENTFLNIKNRSSKITAEIEVPAEGANGAILSQGGRFGGWSLYMKDGRRQTRLRLQLSRTGPLHHCCTARVVAGSCNSRPQLQL